MALNPFFLKGASSEQRLIQDLINEQLGMFGVEITYIPRKFVSKPDDVLNEVQSSKFDDNFSLEAYVNNYDGYGGQGDVLTKFGMSLKDEVTLTISKDRYEDFIAPFLAGLDDGTDTSPITLASRPREGDLIYFPLGERLFEVKFVEHENPFYQLGKTYVYELQCELFEYEDEVIDTSIDAIDTQVSTEGFMNTLQLIGVGRTATAIAAINGFSGYISELFLNNDGSGYTSVPTVAITTSPSGQPGDNAQAVAFTTTRANITSIEKILLTNAGAGYSTAPSITISGGGGIGAAATCSINLTSNGVQRFSVIDGGVGYGAVPKVTVNTITPGAYASATYGPVGAGNSGHITSISVGYGGVGYASTPTVAISTAPDRQDFVETGYVSTVGSGYPNGTADYKVYADSGIGTDAIVNLTVSGGQITAYNDVVYGGHSFNNGYNYCTVVGGNGDGKVRLYSYWNHIERGQTATAEASINVAGVVTAINITNAGYGYTANPTVTISNEYSEKSAPGVTTAIGIASLGRSGSDMVVKAIYVQSAGIGYTVTPNVVIEDPEIMTGVGTYLYNEIVIGEKSRTEARVRNWDADTKILKIAQVGIGSTALGFQVGEKITGQESGAIYSVDVWNKEDTTDKYNQGDEFELEADKILDFTQSNPFGTY